MYLVNILSVFFQYSFNILSIFFHYILTVTIYNIFFVLDCFLVKHLWILNFVGFLLLIISIMISFILELIKYSSPILICLSKLEIHLPLLIEILDGSLINLCLHFLFLHLQLFSILQSSLRWIIFVSESDLDFL